MSKPINKWDDPQASDRTGVDYDNRSMTLDDLVDYCNNHEKQSDKTLAFKINTEYHLINLDKHISVLTEKLEEQQKRIQKLERRVDNNTDYGTGHGY